MKHVLGREVSPNILIFANFLFPLLIRADWKTRDSKMVQRLRGKVSIIRNLGYNYKIARRKKHAGGKKSPEYDY